MPGIQKTRTSLQLKILYNLVIALWLEPSWVYARLLWGCNSWVWLWRATLPWLLLGFNQGPLSHESNTVRSDSISEGSADVDQWRWILHPTRVWIGMNIHTWLQLLCRICGLKSLLFSRSNSRAYYTKRISCPLKIASLWTHCKKCLSCLGPCPGSRWFVTAESVVPAAWHLQAASAFVTPGCRKHRPLWLDMITYQKCWGCITSMNEPYTFPQ